MITIKPEDARFWIAVLKMDLSPETKWRVIDETIAPTRSAPRIYLLEDESGRQVPMDDRCLNIRL